MAMIVKKIPLFLILFFLTQSMVFSAGAESKDNEGIPVQFEGWIEADTQGSNKTKKSFYTVEMPLEIDTKKSIQGIQFDKYLKDPVFITGTIILTKSGKPVLRINRISSKKLEPLEEAPNNYDYVEEEDLDYLNTEFDTIIPEKTSVKIEK